MPQLQRPGLLTTIPENRMVPLEDPFAAFGASSFMGPPRDLRMPGPFVMPPQQDPLSAGSGFQGSFAPPPGTLPPSPAPAQDPLLGRSKGQSIGKPPAPTQTPPDALSDYSALLQRLKEAGDGLAGEHRRIGGEYRDQAQGLMKGDLQYDLSPLAALVDSWTGSSLRSGYKAPETGRERRAEIQGLQKSAQGSELQGRGADLEALRGLAEGTFGLEKFKADQDYRKSTLDLQREQNRIAAAKLRAMNPSLMGGKATEAQKVIDRKFGEQYAADVVGGGLGSSQKELAGLKSLRDQIERSEKGQISGDWRDALPGRSWTRPDAVAVQQQIEKSVQGSLKASLGGSFTEKEGQGILARTFDPTLPEEENVRRLDALIAGLEAVNEAKRAAYDYYEKNGTLRGFQGYDSLENDFLLSISDQKQAPLEDEDRVALDWAKQNASDPRAQAILKANGAR